MRRWLVFVSCLFVATLTTATVRTAPQLPDHFTNLKLLPKDITQAQLVGIMKQFTTDLGVRCEQCHVGQGNDLSKFDFASDDRPDKSTSRIMMTMVATINQDLLKDLAPASGPKVGCYTCHRAALKPPAMAPAGRGRFAAPR